MILVLSVLTVSVFLALGFGMFLRREIQNQTRHFSDVRLALDRVVLGTERFLSRVVGSWARQMLRQVFHYLFHTVLVVMSRLLARAERALRELIRTNRAVARKSEQEQVRSSTLEEVMLHKIAVSLTEEEKKAHKERSLRG